MSKNAIRTRMETAKKEGIPTLKIIEQIHSQFQTNGYAVADIFPDVVALRRTSLNPQMRVPVNDIQPTTEFLAGGDLITNGGNSLYAGDQRIFSKNELLLDTNNWLDHLCSEDSKIVYRKTEYHHSQLQNLSSLPNLDIKYVVFESHVDNSAWSFFITQYARNCQLEIFLKDK